MKLQSVRISNFQCFGEKPVRLRLENITYLIGPNGAGKTAALQALCRLFAFDPSLRRVKRSDFHVPHNETKKPDERKLWIEADFTFPELKDDTDNSTVAPHFSHMRLDDVKGLPRVRFRLDATMDINGDIEETLLYVLDQDSDGSPLNTSQVPRAERNYIQIHYLPARRDPAEHITYSANALMGRLLRSINWDEERETVKNHAEQISNALAKNLSVHSLCETLQKKWQKLHKGSFFVDPQITFLSSEMESLLRHLSISFSPGHDDDLVDFSRLSDGQKSMLYLSLVLSSQAIGRSVLNGQNDTFDPLKLKPPVFTIIAIEEPENSLSPHYLGRIVNALVEMSGNEDAQALIATHAPAMLRRVDPKHIRYLRLTTKRETRISRITLPSKEDDAYKYVREAVQAFPEIYFSRLVVLGEGDSEEIVLPRIFKAKGIPVDESAVTIAPLGGRHVNHFWRLLSGLKIPYITLLDLDLARYQGGWGRIKYVNDQLALYEPQKKLPKDYGIPDWNSDKSKIRDFMHYLEELEKRQVFFSYPMDLDFALLLALPGKYNAKKRKPSMATIKAVLGKSFHDSDQYKDNELKLFSSYHKCFKLSSKPATHLEAFASLSDKELLKVLPPELNRLANAVIKKLSGLPE